MQERRRAWEQKVVEPEVPNRGEGLPKGDDCACASDYRSTDDVPGVVDYPKNRSSSQRLVWVWERK